MGVFHILMKERQDDGSHVDNAIKYTQKAVQYLFDGNVPIKDLILSKQLKGKYKLDGIEEKWTNPKINQPHVKIAQKLMVLNPADHPKPPDRVPFVFIENKQKKCLQWERVSHPDYLDSQKIDTLYYFEHQLREPLLKIFELMVEDPKVIYEELVREKINKMRNQTQLKDFFKISKANKIVKK